ncbi:MAG: hypothetical protein O3A26_05925, partial [Proteobacteria bacterium]|nr:hypothetical protein [Pseudomonadota bacterium]
MFKVIKINFIKFIRFIDIFYKFNTYVLGKSPKKLDNHLRKHYNLPYAKGGVIALVLFAILFRPSFNNTNYAKIAGDKALIVNNYSKDDVLAIDQNLLNFNKTPR